MGEIQADTSKPEQKVKAQRGRGRDRFDSTGDANYLESIKKRLPKDTLGGVALEANIIDLQDALPLIEKEVQRQSDALLSKHSKGKMDVKG